MKVTKTSIAGVVIIEPKIFADNRGYFFESYSKRKWLEEGLDYDFVQDNVSFSHKGVLRGLHLQAGESAQAKLISVMHGKVLDVVVDLRKNSPTFKKYISMEVSLENKRQLVIPRGCAHGFLALTDGVVFSYKCDNFYDPKKEIGIIYNDPELAIDWGMEDSKLIIGERDLRHPPLKSVLNIL